MTTRESSLRTLALLTVLMWCVGVLAVLMGARQQERRTLYVRNFSGDHVGIYYDGRRIGTATAGDNCFVLPRQSSRGELVFHPVGGKSIAVPRELYIESHPHWGVELHPYSLYWDLQSLQPMREACGGKRG
jgi:hypothetical protein